MTMSTQSPASVPVTQNDSLAGLLLHQVSASTPEPDGNAMRLAAAAAEATTATVERSERIVARRGDSGAALVLSPMR